MKTKQESITFLQNEPLMEWKLSLDMIDWSSLLNSERKSLFFGVGLCTSKEPGVSVPFDILQFFLAAERIRQFFSLGKVIIILADDHALTNVFMTREIVDHLRKKVTHTFALVIKNLELSSFEILCASQIKKKSILDKLPVLSNEYLRHEIADVLWLQQNRNLAVKLGWTIDSSAAAGGHDERFFDLQMQKVLPSPISFLFTKAGMTFDPHRPKASPYISVVGEKRLLLDSNEDVPAKLSTASLSAIQRGAVRRHLAHIVHTFEKFFGTIPERSLESKLQHIINLTTREI